MQNELKNQTLIAAEAAKQMGFTNTYQALLEIVRELDPTVDISQTKVIPSVT